MIALSIPILNAIGGAGIALCVVALVAAIACGLMASDDPGTDPAIRWPRLYTDGDYDGGQARWKAQVRRRPRLWGASAVAAVVAVLSIGCAVWALSTASLRTDVNVPGRLNRNQVDVNVNSSNPTGVIIGAG